MAREIQGSTATGKFPPSVRLETKGDYVKGKVTATRDLPADSYGHVNRVLALELIDLEGGSTQISLGEGKYQEVEVAAGDIVDFVGRGTVLREKIPQVNVGEIVTITFQGEGPKKKGRQPAKLFKVVVE